MRIVYRPIHRQRKNAVVCPLFKNEKIVLFCRFFCISVVLTPKSGLAVKSVVLFCKVYFIFFIIWLFEGLP